MANKYNSEWTDAELAAAIDAYLMMLRFEENGQSYNKKEMNEGLREPGAPLEGRTKSSVEYRMQNISSVLRGEKMPIVEGYSPAANVGDRIRTRILRIFHERRKIK